MGLLAPPRPALRQWDVVQVRGTFIPVAPGSLPRADHLALVISTSELALAAKTVWLMPIADPGDVKDASSRYLVPVKLKAHVLSFYKLTAAAVFADTIFAMLANRVEPGVVAKLKDAETRAVLKRVKAVLNLGGGAWF